MYKELREYASQSKISFHMPGSKAGSAIDERDRENVFGIDFTELDSTDNLFNPTGIIKKAEEKIASIYGASSSFMLTCGSTCGILAAFAYIARKGDCIIVDRSVHISVINAIILMDITPIYIYPDYNKNYGFTTTVDIKQIMRLITDNPHVKGVFLTSPNYYGVVSDLTKVSAYLKQKNILLVVDEAHGAHFPFSSLLPNSALSMGADIVIQSVHKTMPAPSQAALLHISENIDEEEMRSAVNLFHTSSPSYIIMGYTDLAIDTMLNEGQVVYAELYDYVENLKKIQPLGIVGADFDNKYYDFSRIVINLSNSNGNGFMLKDFLYNKYDIAVEMADPNNVVCISGKGNTKNHFDILSKGLTQYSKCIKECNKIIDFTLPKSIMAIKPRKAFFSKKVKVKLSESVGRISADIVVSYPPCIPIIIPGEVITNEFVEFITMVLSMGGNIVGILDNEIFVVAQ